jgi:hypothetical protein
VRDARTLELIRTSAVCAEITTALRTRRSLVNKLISARICLRITRIFAAHHDVFGYATERTTFAIAANISCKVLHDHIVPKCGGIDRNNLLSPLDIFF